MSNIKKSAVVVIAKECDERLIRFLCEEFEDYNAYLVTPNSENINLDKINVLDDQSFFDFRSFSEKLKNTNLRVGWYYQQFLKLHVCLNLGYENVYIIDGDSVVSRDKFDTTSISTTGKLAEKKYSDFNKLILGFDADDELSYVTNEMVFNKNILEKLIYEIETKSNKFWVDAILDLLKEHDNVQFSEYQLYGSFAVNKFSYPVHQIKVFRRMDCINDSIVNGLKKFDLLAFEKHHKTGYLRHLRAIILYALGKQLG
jgi:hypothetical protein